MDGYQYEHHCAKLLKQRGFRDVTVTKAVEIKELMSLLIMKTSNTEYNVNIIPTLLAIRLFNKRMLEQNFMIAI